MNHQEIDIEGLYTWIAQYTAEKNTTSAVIQQELIEKFVQITGPYCLAYLLEKVGCIQTIIDNTRTQKQKSQIPSSFDEWSDDSTLVVFGDLLRTSWINLGYDGNYHDKIFTFPLSYLSLSFEEIVERVYQKELPNIRKETFFKGWTKINDDQWSKKLDDHIELSAYRYWKDFSNFVVSVRVKIGNRVGIFRNLVNALHPTQLEFCSKELQNYVKAPFLIHTIKDKDYIALVNEYLEIVCPDDE